MLLLPVVSEERSPNWSSPVVLALWGFSLRMSFASLTASFSLFLPHSPLSCLLCPFLLLSLPCWCRGRGRCAGGMARYSRAFPMRACLSKILHFAALMIAASLLLPLPSCLSRPTALFRACRETILSSAFSFSTQHSTGRTARCTARAPRTRSYYGAHPSFLLPFFFSPPLRTHHFSPPKNPPFGQAEGGGGAVSAPSFPCLTPVCRCALSPSTS
jgi:hypothetical protein